MEQKQWPRKSPSHRVSKETMKVVVFQRRDCSLPLMGNLVESDLARGPWARVLGPIPARGGSYEK